MIFPVHIGAMKSAAGGGGSYDADAQAYFDTLDSAGYPLGTTEKDWVNNRILNLKGQEAGSVALADCVNLWANIEVLIFDTPYNAGAGATAYSVIGGNMPVNRWSALNGFGHSSQQTIAFASGALEMAHGIHTGMGWFGKFYYDGTAIYETICEFTGVEDTNFASRATGKVYAGSNKEYTIGLATGDNMEYHCRIFDRTTNDGLDPPGAFKFYRNGILSQGWTNDADKILPETSYTSSSIKISSKGDWNVKHLIAYHGLDIGSADQDKLKIIFDAVT
jgi:hypothetical protein